MSMEVKTLKQLSLKSQLGNSEDVHTSEVLIICTILGVTDDHFRYLKQLDDEILMHHPMGYYLEKSLDSQVKELKAEGILPQPGKSNLTEYLQKLGFTEQTAKLIAQQIPDEFVNLQKPTYWAERYLNHLWQHHPLLSDSPRYPHSQHILDEWFEIKLPLHPSEIDFEAAMAGLGKIDYFAAQFGSAEVAKCSTPLARNSDSADPCIVRIINISDGSQGNGRVEEYLKELKNCENCLFFHGTTHESAMSLVVGGILLRRGSKRQDFSSGDGFYVSDTFENAKAWSQAGRGGHQAVVVYNVKKSLLNGSNSLDLSQDRSRWEEVVRSCRIGYTDKMSRQDLEKYAVIQGPPCKNPGDIKGSNPLQPFQEAGIQLCIHEDSFAEEFGSLTNVACVIFY